MDILSLHVFELFEVVHVQRLLLRNLGRIQRLLLKLYTQAPDQLVVAVVLLLDDMRRRNSFGLVILIIFLPDIGRLLDRRL